MTRRQMLTALFGAAVLTLPMAGCGNQPVQDEPGAELILRYAENQPEDYPTTQAALAFADLVAQRTDGRVKVLVYSGGELGAEQSVIQQMQFGGIDFSRVSLSQLAEYEPALHNGEIDGAENNWPSYEAMGHYEVAPYFLKDEHTRVPEVQLASPAVMEKLAALDERYPEIIRLCARESAKVERRLWAQQEAESESDLRAAGIEVTELDEEEKARFRAAVQPMYDRFAQQGELIARIRQG